MTASFSLRRPATRLVQRYLEPCPQEGIGIADCVRTALAMILGLEAPEDVPHLLNAAQTGLDWAAIAAWLAERGVQIVHVPLPNWSARAIEERLPHWLGRAPAILGGNTVEGHGHVVAVIDGQIVDTVDYTTGNPIVEPGNDGLFWLILLVPLPEKDTP